MFFSHRKYKDGQHRGNQLRDRTAAGIVQRCTSVQAAWANRMQQKWDKLPGCAKRYWLLLFCMLSTGANLLVVVHSLRITYGHGLDVIPIRVPAHATSVNKVSVHTQEPTGNDEFRGIEKFRFYLDSLNRSEAGQRLRDSMLHTRPGLMDSIRVLENIYRSQFFKKQVP